MNSQKLFRRYLFSLAIFLFLDFIWLGLIANGLYQNHLGHLLSENVDWLAALLFYLVFLTGLNVFVISPAIQLRSLSKAIVLGALYGAVTYATYDLTNQATMRNWPWFISCMDIAWGAFICAAAAAGSFFLETRLKRRMA